jgi:hypothetical protein
MQMLHDAFATAVPRAALARGDRRRMPEMPRNKGFGPLAGARRRARRFGPRGIGCLRFTQGVMRR